MKLSVVLTVVLGLLCLAGVSLASSSCDVTCELVNPLDNEFGAAGQTIQIQVAEHLCQLARGTILEYHCPP